MDKKVEILKDLYAALNRNDIPGVVASFAPEVTWTEPDHFGTGTQKGLDAVRNHFAAGRDTWAEGTCEPERFIAAGDKIVAFSYVHVRLKGQTEWVQGPMAEVYTFRDGKIIQARVFDDRQESLEWAGIAE